MDHSTLDLDPSFTIGHSYFSHDQPGLPHNEDYKNILGSSSSYHFNNSYQACSFMNEHQYDGNNPPYLNSESTLYSLDSNVKKEKSVIDQCKEENNIPTVNRFTKINLSQNMTSVETPSTSMLSEHEHDLITKDYDRGDDENDVAGPSTFSYLDSLLQY